MRVFLLLIGVLAAIGSFFAKNSSSLLTKIYRVIEFIFFINNNTAFLLLPLNFPENVILTLVDLL